MPSCSMTLSPSRFSSKVKPYWKPEHPPPCTKTRRGFPTESGIVCAKYLTFATAASVSESIGLGAVIGVGVDSRVEDMESPLNSGLYPLGRELGERAASSARKPS